jgi:uncharacterized protein (DUF427 family)
MQTVALGRVISHKTSNFFYVIVDRQLLSDLFCEGILMATTTGNEQVTLSTETIHNPAEPRHYMRLKPVKGSIRIICDGQELARSDNAIRLLEVGRDLYDPTIYFPREDLICELNAKEKRSYCPLKGYASYFDVVTLGALGEDLVWSYEDTLDFADGLRDLMAFFPSRVVVEEHPPG